MPSSISPMFRISQEGRHNFYTEPVIDNNTNWSIGKPTPIYSPLVSQNLHPWQLYHVYGSQILKPRYTLATSTGCCHDGFSFPFNQLRGMICNKPTFISDHHILSLRRQTEALWAPKIKGHIHLNTTGELLVNSLYRVIHRRVKAAYTIGYSAFGDAANHRLYSFGDGGTLIRGHTHVWNAGGTGSITWTAKLFFDHADCIDEEHGNYEILETTYSYTEELFYRTVYSQDHGRQFTHDRDAYTQHFQCMIPTRFRYDEVMGYCMDAGALWLSPANTVYDPETGQYSIPPLLSDQTYLFTACSLTYRENQAQKWFSGDRSHTCVSGPTGVTERLGHNWWDDPGDPGESIVKNIRYWSKTNTYSGEGDTFTAGPYLCLATTPSEVLEEETVKDGWITTLIGTKITPTFTVRYRDWVGKEHVYVCTDIEFPNSKGM